MDWICQDYSNATLGAGVTAFLFLVKRVEKTKTAGATSLCGSPGCFHAEH